MCDKTLWCHNAKTGEVFSYKEAGSITDFPRGVLLAYGDYLTTGLKSKDEALEWAGKWSACTRCKSSMWNTENMCCANCGTALTVMPVNVTL